MRTHTSIIADAGGYQAFAQAIGPGEAVLVKRAKFWSRRGSIPDHYWHAVALAKLSTLEELATAAAIAAGHLRKAEPGFVGPADAGHVDTSNYPRTGDKVPQESGQVSGKIAQVFP
jgi:hypothetical protein